MQSKAKSKILSWGILLAFMGGLAGIYMASQAGNYPILLALLAALGAVFWYFARQGRKYYQDHPLEAAEAKVRREVMQATVQARANRRFKQKMLFLPFVLLAVFLTNIVQRHSAFLHRFSSKDGVVYLSLAAICIVVAGYSGYQTWKKRRTPV
jgi:drug/metabolite transporter (DMT)-like permease